MGVVETPVYNARPEVAPQQAAGGDRPGGWCAWRWPGGVSPQAGKWSGGLSGPSLRTTAPPGRLSGPVAGGRAWGCRGPNSIARRSPPCQAASVRGQSNQVLSEVLRAGHASAAGLSLLSTSDSYSRWTNRSAHLCSKTVRATFMAHGSSVMRPLSSGIPSVVYDSWGDL